MKKADLVATALIVMDVQTGAIAAGHAMATRPAGLGVGVDESVVDNPAATYAR